MTPPDDTRHLRSRAVQWLREGTAPGVLARSELGESVAMLEELRIYQAELEVQNDELRSTQASNERLAQRFAQMFRFAPTALLQVDRLGSVVDANEEAHRLFRLGAARARQVFLFRLVADPHRPVVDAAFLRAGRAESGLTPVVANDVMLRAHDGTLFRGDLHVMPLPAASVAGGNAEFLCAVVDQTRLADQAERLQDHAARLQVYASAFENINEAIVITDTQLGVVSVNAALTRITGLAEAQAIGGPLAQLLDAEQAEMTQREIAVALESQGHWEGEVSGRAAGGGAFPCWMSIVALRNAQGAPWRYVGVVTDLTAARDQQEQLRRMANEDALTALPNRHRMGELLTHAFERARRLNRKVGLMFADLDDFKRINDGLGHQAGDATLVEVARRWKQRLRETDALVRFGGDEFLVISENLQGPADASRLAADLIGALQAPIELPDQRPLFVGCSIGICLYPDDGDHAGRLVQQADAAMYRAKAHGRNRYEFFTATFMSEVRDELEIANDLRHALARGEFFLEYQPLLPTHAGARVEVEALLRWRHPRRGVLLPTMFLEMAERVGVGQEIHHWVLSEACRAMRRLADAGVAVDCMAVNTSAREFERADIHARISQALHASGLHGHQLKLEVTEAALMRNLDHARHVLRGLRDHGVRVAVDDFGTGFSSLAYLRMLPLDALKIDRSFLTDIAGDATARAVTQAIVTLGKSLRLDVVAEGVERIEQATALHALDVDHLQGWLFSASVAEAHLPAVLDALPRLPAQMRLPLGAS